MEKPPTLVIFCGIPGCGKTTIARIVCDSVPGAVHIQTDGVRTMISRPTYSGPESAFVYEACFSIAKDSLRSQRLTVLDATFMLEEYRTMAVTALAGMYGRYLVVHVVCALETAEKRNTSRSAVVPPEKLRRMYDDFEPPIDALRVDSDAHSPAENAETILAALKPAT
jgi:predicted kinase